MGEVPAGQRADARRARAPATTSTCPGRWATRRSRSRRSKAARRSTPTRWRRRARGSRRRSRASRSAQRCAASRRAALDVSDGLAGDLGAHPRALAASARRSTWRRLPRSPALDAKLGRCERALALECLLAGGDDYELCFTAPPAAPRAIVRRSRASSALPLTRIGAITAEPAFVVRDEHGAPLADAAARVRSFRASRMNAPAAARRPSRSCSRIRRISSRWASAPASRRSRRARSARWWRFRSRWLLQALRQRRRCSSRRSCVAVRRRCVGGAGDRPPPRRARPRRIVIDEVVAFLLVLFFVGATPLRHGGRVRAVPLVRHREAAADPAARRARSRTASA